MALTSSISYCTDQDVFDLYPIDRFDQKRELTNKWEQDGAKYYYHNSGKVYRLFKNGKDLGVEEDEGQINTPNEWFYNQQLDYVIINQSRIGGGVDPNLEFYEAGVIWEDLIERIRLKASRIIESSLDTSMVREIIKDREGNYPTSIIRATALKTAILLIMAHDPTHVDLASLNDEYRDIISGLSKGTVPLSPRSEARLSRIRADKLRGEKQRSLRISGHRSAGDSKGTIRIVKEGEFEHSVYPVQMRGSYKGSEYELLKVQIGGTLLTGTRDKDQGDLVYSVYGKSSDKLKDTLLVDNEFVSGDFQSLGLGNMAIRWGFSEYENLKHSVRGYTAFAEGSDDARPTRLKSGYNGTIILYDQESITMRGSHYFSFEYAHSLGNLFGDNFPTEYSAGNASFRWYQDGATRFALAILQSDLSLFWIYSSTDAKYRKLYQYYPDGDDIGRKVSYQIVLTEVFEHTSIVYTSNWNASNPNGFPAWNDYKSGPAEYEIELWGSGLAAGISQTQTKTLSRDNLWL